MTAWRSKRMLFDDWVTFQNAFEGLFQAFQADERMALFVRDGPNEGEHTVLITQHNADVVERLSPDGWDDHPNPEQQQWTLLVGDPNAFELKLA